MDQAGELFQIKNNLVKIENSLVLNSHYWRLVLRGCWLLRAELGGIPWEASMEDKGASECWEFLQNSLLEAWNQSIPFKWKGSRWSKRSSWLNCKLLRLLKTKRGVYQGWKSEQIPAENYKGIARACRGAVRKVKAQLDLKVAGEVKNYRKGFFKIINNERKQRKMLALC